MGRGQPDEAFFAQRRKGATDRFDGQAKIVGDVAPTHREVELGATVATSRAVAQLGDQKGGNPFFCCLTTETEHLFLSRREFVVGNFIEPLADLGHFFQQSLEFPDFEAAKIRFGDRFGGVGVGLPGREAQKIAGSQKSGDLSTAVLEQFEQPDMPTRNVVDELRFVTFLKDRLTGPDLDMGHNPVKNLHAICFDRGAHRLVPHAALPTSSGQAKTRCLTMAQGHSDSNPVLSSSELIHRKYRAVQAGP